MTTTSGPSAASPRSMDGRALELVWLAPVLAGAVVAALTAARPEVVLPLLAVALVPWALHAVRVPMPAWLFGLLTLAPVAAVLVAEGVGAVIFLGTTAISLLASRAARPWQLVVVVALAAVLPFVSALGPGPFDPGCFYFAIGDLLAVAVGLLLGRSLRLAEQLREADARLLAVRTQQERTRLARDVHDLVAHSLTVVVLHVGGARRILRSDPEAAEQALVQAEQVCRESLDGIRGVVGLLRAADDLPPGAEDLHGLVRTYRAAGMRLVDRLAPDVDRLPLLLRSLLHRVAQEALANAARYRSPDSEVLLTCHLDGDAVVLTVENPASAARQATTGGFGLLGLREQVTGAGGTLTTRWLDGRWRFESRLPLAAAFEPAR